MTLHGVDHKTTRQLARDLVAQCEQLERRLQDCTLEEALAKKNEKAKRDGYAEAWEDCFGEDGAFDSWLTAEKLYVARHRETVEVIEQFVNLLELAKLRLGISVEQPSEKKAQAGRPAHEVARGLKALTADPRVLANNLRANLQRMVDEGKL